MAQEWKSQKSQFSQQIVPKVEKINQPKKDTKTQHYLGNTT